MKAKLVAGVELDMLSPAELRSELDRQLARNNHTVEPKYWAFSTPTLPALLTAPDPGFLWSMRLLSATFDVGDGMLVMVKEPSDTNIVGYSSTVDTRHVYQWSSKSGLVLPTVGIYLASATGKASSARGTMIYEETTVGNLWRL
ncbi:hypothetical protein ACFWY9_30600 [Amycolatopsis sp. NPDC059027]|uniref:hypothetical protein n=1 Tax=Amycolatopsis sp. NPDC059027 TaxID=3346709 RepID=UPI00366F7ED0